MKRSVIIRNSAVCLDCGEEIESSHVHDFRSCACGHMFVDGGLEYLRRGGIDLNGIKETSIEEPIKCKICSSNDWKFFYNSFEDSGYLCLQCDNVENHEPKV